MGGTENGLSKEAIQKSLYMASKFYKDPETFIKNGDNYNNMQINEAIVRETEEIIKYLGSDKGGLSIEEFVNAMASNSEFPSNNEINQDFNKL